MDTIFNNTASLGFNLQITPLLWHKKCKVVLPNCQFSKKVAEIYKNLAEVEFSAGNLPPLKMADTQENTCLRIMREHGLYGENVKIKIPKIFLSQGEIEWGRRFISKYNKPIVLIANNSGGNDPNNPFAQYLQGPHEIYEDICDFLLEKGYTVLQFGLSTNFYRNGYSSFNPIKGAIPILDLSIREEASCYYSIRNIISPETGTYHLMLAVGGKAIVIIPPETRFFNYKTLLYTRECWNLESSRVLYLSQTFSNKELCNFIDIALQ